MFLYFNNIKIWKIKKVFLYKSTSSGDRTRDHKIKSLALYHLSYGGIFFKKDYTYVKFLKKRTQKSPWRGSNPWPQAYEACAITTMLHGQRNQPVTRFELVTLCLQGRCNNHYATPALDIIFNFMKTNIFFIFFKLKKIKKTPSVGIEPTAIGLKGQRSTVWAKKALDDVVRI